MLASSYRLLSNCIDCTANHTLYIVSQPPMSLVYTSIIHHWQARCWVDEVTHCSCSTFFLNRSLYSSCVCIIYPSLICCICQSKFGNLIEILKSFSMILYFFPCPLSSAININFNSIRFTWPLGLFPHTWYCFCCAVFSVTHSSV